MIQKYILLLLISTVFFSACDERLNDPVVSLNTRPMITTPTGGVEFVLDETMLETAVTVFEWTAADFGYQAAITYSLSIDSEGNDFAEAITLGSTTNLSLEDLTIGRINNILLAKGLPNGFPNPLEIRVCAKVSDFVDEMCSDPVAIKITPFQADVVYPFLTVPGDYQDWKPEDENYKVFSRKSDEIYEGYIYFPFTADTVFFKYAQGLNWDINWGDIEPDGMLDAGGVGNDIPISDGTGIYFLQCDLNTLTHFNLKTTWGVLGTATPTGTSADTDLAWDMDKGALTVTLDLSVGSLRFRANDADDINFGDDFANGSLEADGADIEITEAGNYTIDLFLTQSDYAFELTKN